MNTLTQERRDHRFMIGLLAGTLVGAGLAMWLAPRSASELRGRLTGSVRNLGKRASNRFQDASTRVGGAVDELTRKGQGIRDDVADAVAHGAHEVERGAREVARGAHEVERFATAAKSPART